MLNGSKYFTSLSGLYAFFISVPQEIDEYELVDPVDILAPLEKSGFWEGVVSILLRLLYAVSFCSIPQSFPFM